MLRRTSGPAGAGLFFFLLLTSTSGAELHRYEYSADAMGGNFSVTLYSADRSDADAAAEAAFGELRRLDSVLSNYRSESEWSAANRYAAERPVKVSQELFDLLSECLEYSRRSEGAFDITVGPLMRAWGFVAGRGKLLDEDEVKQALAHVGYSHLLLDPKSRTVRFARAQMEIDSGGIGKGYAVDRMIGVLKQHGVDRALLSAAGSTIYALGVPPGREGWPVNIGLSGKPDLAAGRLMLKDESLSTSGISEKFLRIGGHIYGHILDPRTGYPARGVLLAAVKAPRAIDSEAWTKAFFVNGGDWAARHMPAGFRVLLCEEESGCPRCTWMP
jgi:FAD:protein FMN transferase